MGRDKNPSRPAPGSQNFNPRARVGRDSSVQAFDVSFHAFQSTRPCGARRQKEQLCRAAQHFNPRARVGRDSNKRPTFRAYRNFNPRARVGRDRCHTVLTVTMCHFNPRARVGRDGSILIPCCFASYFNPRARVGRDEAQRRKLFNWFIFQSTRPCGARLSPWSSIRLIM